MAGPLPCKGSWDCGLWPLLAISLIHTYVCCNSTTGFLCIRMLATWSKVILPLALELPAALWCCTTTSWTPMTTTPSCCRLFARLELAPHHAERLPFSWLPRRLHALPPDPCRWPTCTRRLGYPTFIIIFGVYLLLLDGQLLLVVRLAPHSSVLIPILMPLTQG